MSFIPRLATVNGLLTDARENAPLLPRPVAEDLEWCMREIATILDDPRVAIPTVGPPPKLYTVEYVLGKRGGTIDAWFQTLNQHGDRLHPASGLYYAVNAHLVVRDIITTWKNE